MIMTKKNISAMTRVLAVLLVLVLFSVNAHARIILNGLSGAFTESESPEIEEQVIQAAGYFLKSQSDLLLFMNKIELSDLTGVDYTELQSLIDSASANMKDANTIYINLANTVENIEYNQDVITMLINFNYSSSRDTLGLNPSVFQQVETYLGSGDIRGIYHKMVTDTGNIIDLLTTIKTAVDAREFPLMEDLWKVDEYVAEILLFGQYIARVLYNVTGK